MTDDALPKVGDLIDDRYELLEKIGEGGFGVVYKARQLSTEQLVAVKVLLPRRLNEERYKRQEILRFRREMKLIGQLSHSHIVRLIDSGTLESDSLYMVLEFIEGQPLSMILKRRGALSPKTTVHLMTQVLEALHVAHEKGVIHRDLKPGNIMVTEQGARPTATVLDFGIAGVMEESRTDDFEGVTGTRDTLGTPAYMSPEQIDGGASSVGPGADLYAWGIIMIECLTGRSAFSGASVMALLLKQVSSDRLELPPEIEEHPLGAVIDRATLKDREKRYRSANNTLRDLLAIPQSALEDAPLVVSRVTSDAAYATMPGAPDMETLDGAAISADAPTVDSTRFDELDQALTSPWEKPDDAPHDVPSDALTTPFRPEPEFEPDNDEKETASSSNPLWLVLGAMVGLGIVLLILFLEREPPAEPSETSPDPATSSTPVVDAEVSAPDVADSQASDLSEPSRAEPARVSLERAVVNLGLSMSELEALRSTCGDACEFEIAHDVAVLPAELWTRPALEVMAFETTWEQWNARRDGVKPDPRCEGSAGVNPGEGHMAAVGMTPLEAEQVCLAMEMRLPTAREWEAIARGPGDLRYGIEGGLSPDRLVALGQPGQPGQLTWNHNGHGVYDLAGGVKEWVRCSSPLAYCVDGFGVRGGASGDAAHAFHSAVMGLAPNGACPRSERIGFRCVRALE